MCAGSFSLCCTVLEGVTDQPRGPHEENVEEAGPGGREARAAPRAEGTGPSGGSGQDHARGGGSRGQPGRKAVFPGDAGRRGVSAFSSTPCAG